MNRYADAEISESLALFASGPGVDQTTSQDTAPVAMSVAPASAVAARRGAMIFAVDASAAPAACEPVALDLPKTIHELMKAHGMTYEAMTDAIGASNTSTVSRHMSRRNKVSLEYVQMYAAAFGMPASALIALAEVRKEFEGE